MTTAAVPASDVTEGHPQRRQILAVCCLCLVTVVLSVTTPFTNATNVAFLVAALLMVVGSAAYWRMCRGRLTVGPLDHATDKAPEGSALAATVPCSR